MFESLIPRGKMGRPEEICDGRAVSCFRRSELREWGGVVCRRRLLGNLNRRISVTVHDRQGTHRDPIGNQKSASQHCSVT